MADGWSHVCLVNNHLEPARHDDAVRLAICGLERVAIGRLPAERRWARTLSDEFKRGNCHAGRYETSLVMAAGGHVHDGFTSLPDVDVSLSAGIERPLGRATSSPPRGLRAPTRGRRLRRRWRRGRRCTRSLWRWSSVRWWKGWRKEGSRSPETRPRDDSRDGAVPAMRRLLHCADGGVPAMRRLLHGADGGVPAMRRLLHCADGGVPAMRRPLHGADGGVPAMRRPLHGADGGVPAMRRPLQSRTGVSPQCAGYAGKSSRPPPTRDDAPPPSWTRVPPT